jgi:hypothetical protein
VHIRRWVWISRSSASRVPSAASPATGRGRWRARRHGGTSRRVRV